MNIGTGSNQFFHDFQMTIIHTTSWIQLGSNIDGDTANDKAGSSVSLNSAGDRVAIGTPNSNSFTGHVRIYEWNNTSWVQLGSDINGNSANDTSGSSVSINSDGDRVAIGSPGFGSIAGYTSIYEWNNTSWVQLGLDINGEET